MEDVREHEAASCICGYHIYRDIWTAAIGEELDCVRESGNMRDRYAGAVKRAGVTVGHLPVCSLFLRIRKTNLPLQIPQERHSSTLQSSETWQRN